MKTCEKGLGFRPAWGFCQVCVPAVPCVQVTGELAVEPPLQLPGLRGGIFSDEPGLGKTVTALSLILKTQVGLLGAGRWRGFGGVDVCVVRGSAWVHGRPGTASNSARDETVGSGCPKHNFATGLPSCRCLGAEPSTVCCRTSSCRVHCISISNQKGVLLFHCNRSSSAAVVSGYHPNCPPWCQRHMAAVPRWQAPRVLHPSRPRQPPRPLSRTCSSRRHSSRARQEEQQR